MQVVTNTQGLMSNLTKYREELDKLIERGEGMLLDLLVTTHPEAAKSLTKEQADLLRTNRASFSDSYQRWYTESAAVIRQILIDRLSEFESYYRVDPKRKAVNALTYRIQDWVNGSRAATDYNGKKYFGDEAIVSMGFQTQINILQSAAARFDSALLDIRSILQADLFDSEIAAARELLRKGFLRPAGVLAGVVLERHLAEVCKKHKLVIRSKQPGLSDFNDLLKANETIDVPTWRFIQRLGDLRNLCAHNKDREPNLEDSRELVDGVERITKTLF